MFTMRLLNGCIYMVCNRIALKPNLKSYTFWLNQPMHSFYELESLSITCQKHKCMIYLKNLLESI